MGVEYIVPPQVFLGGLTALGPGIQGLTENYPLLTTYQTWTSTASIDTSAFQIPGLWAIYDGPNKEGSFVVSVGGVIQPPTTYTIDIISRLLTFNTIVSAGIEIAATQLATASPSSQRFDFIKALSGEFNDVFISSSTFQDVTATNLTILNTYTSAVVFDTTIYRFTSADLLTAVSGLFYTNLSVQGQMLSGGIPLHNIFLTSETDSQNLAYNEATYQLNISNGNFVNLSSINTTFAQNSSFWTSTYTTVQSNSATTWNYQGTDLKALSSNWQNTYTTVQNNSATIWNYQGTDLKSLSGNWQNTYTTVQNNSAENTLTTSVCAISGDGATPFVMQFTKGLLTGITF